MPCAQSVESIKGQWESMKKHKISRRVLFEGVYGGGGRGVVDEVRWKKVLKVCPHFKEVGVIAGAEKARGIAAGSNTRDGEGNEEVSREEEEQA